MRKGFSLFELIIVTVLIGLIYGLFLHSNQTAKAQKEKKDFRHIKTLLLETNTTTATFFCEEKCIKCYIKTEENKKILLNTKLFPKEPRVYFFNNDGLLEEYDNERYCFEYKRFANASFSESVIELENKWYYFDTFSNGMKLFENESAVLDYKEELFKKVRDD